MNFNPTRDELMIMIGEREFVIYKQKLIITVLNQKIEEMAVEFSKLMEDNAAKDKTISDLKGESFEHRPAKES